MLWTLVKWDPRPRRRVDESARSSHAADADADARGEERAKNPFLSKRSVSRGCVVCRRGKDDAGIVVQCEHLSVR